MDGNGSQNQKPQEAPPPGASRFSATVRQLPQGGGRIDVELQLANIGNFVFAKQLPADAAIALGVKLMEVGKMSKAGLIQAEPAQPKPNGGPHAI